MVAPRSQRGVRASGRAPPKPAGANFYPADATKAEVEKWIASLPEAERARATGFFTVVRRGANGFTLVPYNVEYQSELARAAALLRDAAALTQGADAEGVSHQAAPMRFSRTITTTATSRGWS